MEKKKNIHTRLTGCSIDPMIDLSPATLYTESWAIKEKGSLRSRFSVSRELGIVNYCFLFCPPELTGAPQCGGGSVCVWGLLSCQSGIWVVTDIQVCFILFVFCVFYFFMYWVFFSVSFFMYWVGLMCLFLCIEWVFSFFCTTFIWKAIKTNLLRKQQLWLKEHKVIICKAPFTVLNWGISPLFGCMWWKEIWICTELHTDWVGGLIFMPLAPPCNLYGYNVLYRVHQGLRLRLRRLSTLINIMSL